MHSATHNINMIVNAFALITALVYIMNIPITAKISLLKSGDINAVIGVFNTKSGININTSLQKLISGLFKGKKRAKPADARAIIKSVRFHSVKIRLSMPNACHTAIVSGMIAILLSVLGVGFYKVTPAFDECETVVNAECIVSLTVGKAFMAAANIALGAFKESMNNGTKRTDRRHNGAGDGLAARYG